MDDNSFIIKEVDTTADIECISLSTYKECGTMFTYDLKNKDSLKVFTVNIRSINCNFDIFVALISSIDLSIDVFVLTECWTSSLNPPPNLDYYSTFWTKNCLNQNDGVVAYVRHGLEVSSYEPEFSDGNCLVLNIAPDYIIVCSYRPPSFRNVSNYLASVDNILAGISAKNVVFTGDINIDLMPCDLSASSQEYLNLMAMHGLRQGVNLPTRINTCIDHFMVKTQGSWKTIVFEQPLTDHSPIMLYMSNAKPSRNDITFKKVTINYEKINDLLSKESWEDLFKLNTVNFATELFTAKILNLININTEIKSVTKRNQPLKPWITRGVVRSIRKRDRLHLKVKKTPNNDKIRNKYLKYRNTCNNIIRNLKKEYYKNKLLKNQGNIKETWKIVKEVCNFNQVKVPSRDLLNIGNNPIDSLNKVNKYFTSIGGTLADKTLNMMKTTEKQLASLAKTVHSPSFSMSLIPTDPLEVKNIIFGLKSQSAPGWDKITTKFLKSSYPYIIEPISFICNLSFETGVFPALFKKAVVCPIFKSGDKTSPSNYRPISLLSTLSKILEKLVKKRVMNYLEKYNLLSQNQYGFREQKSTEDAVLRLTSLVTSYMDQRNKCVGVFLDLQKAFDTVSIPILLTRMENVGIRGLTLDWFGDYLSGRTQSVKVEDHTSESARCTYGVPQGSTLGPTLFLIYINELCCTTLQGLDLLMFADDTVLLLHDKTWQSVTELAETCLSKVTEWLENSLLSLNTDKTKYMCYSITQAGNHSSSSGLKIHSFPCNRSTIRSAQCSCAMLSRVETIKYLGVYIDDKLNWSTHIVSLASRVRKLIYVYKALRTVADVELLIRTYKALCECLIRYCICAWGSAAKTHIIRAERAQRALLKVILYLSFRHPTTAVYERANVLTVRKLFIYEGLQRFHKKAIPNLPESFKRVDRIPVPWVKTRFAQKQFDVVVPQVYNKLAKILKVENIKKLNRIQFKSKIFTWLKCCDYAGIENMLENLYF